MAGTKKILEYGLIAGGLFAAIGGSFLWGRATATEADVQKTLTKRVVNKILDDPDVSRVDKEIIKRHKKLYIQFMDDRLKETPTIAKAPPKDIVEIKVFVDWMKEERPTKSGKKAA